MDRITSQYLHALQAIYYDIGDRGIRVDLERIKKMKAKVSALIDHNLQIASSQWGCRVYIGAENNDKADLTSVNINSTSGERSLLSKLKNLGYHVPKITSKNEEGEYEQKFSTGELALQKMLAENQFKYPGGDPAIRAVLKIRELGKLQNGYLNTRFLRRTDEKGNALYYFLSTYNVPGTVSGRRSSKRHTFGFGNNAQNFPKHSETAAYIRECLIPKDGYIFLFVDQMQAEEWPVSALSMNLSALADLRAGADRHSKLASAIFQENIPPKGSPEWDDDLHDKKRYLGKKVKHARNYGMREKRMSESLAQEGFSVDVATCKILLDRAAAVDPTVDTVFHVYVKNEISNTHMLKTPFGRERMFIGARPNADNNTLFNEAYSWIPQSTVGDNTGFAVYNLETDETVGERYIIQEGHDSIGQEIRAEPEEIWKQLQRTVKAFDRRIVFHNGIEINIPIEAELGFDFNTVVKIKEMSLEGVKKAFEKIVEKREEKRNQEIAA